MDYQPYQSDDNSNQSYNNYSYQPNQNQYQRGPNKRSTAMETAALVLGIISVSTCSCIYLSIACGALSVIMALLSKGGANSISERAKIGLILGVAGMIITVIFYASAFVVVMNEYGSIDNVMKAFADMNGMSYEELMEQFNQYSR